MKKAQPSSQNSSENEPCSYPIQVEMKQNKQQ